MLHFEKNTEDLETDGSTTESTAISMASKECKDGTSSVADKVRLDENEECTDEMETTDMDASMHLLVKDEACLKLRC